VVVEAARQSGSLITARFALEQNREVFAVPGHPLDPRAAGPNELIRSGATLIRNSGDALSVLRPLMQGDELYYFSEDGALEPPTPPRAPMDLSAKDRDAVLTALSVTPVTVNDLIRATGLSARAVNVAVLELTLAGKVRHEGLARIAAKPERLQADY
jgi:DNA processing protein